MVPLFPLPMVTINNFLADLFICQVLKNCQTLPPLSDVCTARSCVHVSTGKLPTSCVSYYGDCLHYSAYNCCTENYTQLIIQQMTKFHLLMILSVILLLSIFIEVFIYYHDYHYILIIYHNHVQFNM